MRVVVLIAVCILAGSVHAQVQNSDLEELAGHSTNFATTLYREIASASDDNVAMSPLAATVGLASLAAGTDVDTHRALFQMLGLAALERDGEPDRIPTLLKQLRETSDQSTGLFISQQFEPEPGFSSRVKQFYNTDVQSVDFTNVGKTKQQINDYLKGSIGNYAIKEFAGELNPQTQLMLISAASFKGQRDFLFNDLIFTSISRGRYC